MLKSNPHSQKHGLFDFLSTFFDKGSNQANEIKRPPRLALSRLHAVSFDMNYPQEQPGLGVANISRTGIGILASHTQWPPTGQSVQGILNILHYKLPTTLRLVHTSSLIAGCHFAVIGQEYSEILTHYFDAELDAVQLIKIKPEYIKADPDGTAVWFKGLDNSELYFVHQDGRLLHFAVTFLGNTISWPQRDNTKTTNYAGQASQALSANYSESDLATATLKFIHNIRGLKKSFYDQIEEILLTTPEHDPRP